MDWRKQVSTDLKMNSKIINLRRERKRRKKTALEEEAQMNRVKAGQTRSEKRKMKTINKNQIKRNKIIAYFHFRGRAIVTP